MGYVTVRDNNPQCFNKAIYVAAGGSAATLSRPLRRFEALATALWTVQYKLRPASTPGPNTTYLRVRSLR